MKNHKSSICTVLFWVAVALWVCQATAFAGFQFGSTGPYIKVMVTGEYKVMTPCITDKENSPASAKVFITVANNWEIWYEVAVRGSGGTNRVSNLPDSFLLAPGEEEFVAIRDF